MAHATIGEAARAVGIAEVTAWRWLRDPEFNREYRTARRDALMQTTTRLQAASAAAVETLMAIMREGESDSARVAAARTVLDNAIRAADLEDVQQRLDVLETHMKERRTANDRTNEAAN